ncbi:hypothetical protein J6590_108324 [Homalodisca vitripennis]|nr:hypothetical protein J6590_108324 [Homalodisca vitripennis]
MELITESWDSVHNAQDAEEAYNSFHAIVRRALDIACPLSKSRPRGKPKLKFQYDPEVNTLKEDFLKGLYRYELTGSELDKDTMKQKKKTYDLKLRELRRAAANEHIASSDNKSKALWSIISGEKQQKKSDDTLRQLEIDGKIEDSPMVIAEHLNSYFCRVADITLNQNRSALQINTVPPQPTANIQQNPQLTMAPTTHNEVLSVIQTLKPKLSCGIDEVPSKAVKHCANQLAAPLVTIINKSFDNGHFPSKLKLSKVYPKHKKGSKTKLENYRPISLISPFSKIIEKIALKRMVQHLQEQELLSNCQHGFLKGRSTITAMTSLVEHITDQLEDNKFVSAILLDYSKAFDCLGHDLIVKKLSILGFQGKSRHWVASYLADRSQIVEIHRTINNKSCTFRSQTQPITRGVPQGSVLGPFLFVLFTNDFNDFINHNNILPIMYADDTTLLLQHDTAQGLHSTITTSTGKALQYCLQNDLAINPSKTTQLNFSRRHEQIPEVPNILVENHSKLLGMTIDTNLSWTEHADTLSKKLGPGIFVVRRIKWIAGQEAAKAAYHALVESHIRYGLTIWGGTSQQNLDRILVQQKKAIRALANLTPTESCRDAFKSLRIMTVIALYIYSVVVYTDQAELTTGENIHSYNTRRAADYHLPAHRTTQYSRKPSYIGRKVFNSLPTNLKILNGQQLKRHLQDWLMERPFYSMKEYFETR